MTSESAISTRIPAKLKKRLQQYVSRFGYVNESDFIREAIRMHIAGLEASERTNEKQWWEYLDWSTMRRTFMSLPDHLKEVVREKGRWSLGKEKFVDKEK